MVLKKLASDRVTVVLPRSEFCEGAICESKENGAILFRDDDHLTSAGSKLVVDDLRFALAGA